MHTDPLFEYEQKLIQKLSRPSYTRVFWRWLKFLIVYLLLSGTIFSVLVGLLNFGAYSARVLDWINPAALENIKNDLTNVISKSSIEVHASESERAEKIESREVLTEKIANSDPSIVYSRSYSSDRLLWSVTNTISSQATFQVTPYENRIIIPSIGKNIPLIDVHHDEGSSYTQMHEVFMEELKKGVVRYPGTALPGEVGNAFIFGHSSNYPWIQSDYNDVFALLDTLKNGDEVIIFYNQKKFVYKITDRAVVKPWDVKALESRDPTKKELSLMTCWPIGTTLERIILFAELQE